MKIVYKADDGEEFDCAKTCQAYEKTQIARIRLTAFLDEYMIASIDRNWMRELLLHKKNELIEILTGTNKDTGNYFISDKGRTSEGHPLDIFGSDQVKVMFRNGYMTVNRADTWISNWKDTNSPSDIINYRKV